MTSALEGGRGVVEKWTRVLISCVIMYVTRGEGVKKFEIFMDVIDGSPLMRPRSSVRSLVATTVLVLHRIIILVRNRVARNIKNVKCDVIAMPSLFVMIAA